MIKALTSYENVVMTLDWSFIEIIIHRKFSSMKTNKHRTLSFDTNKNTEHEFSHFFIQIKLLNDIGGIKIRH